MRDAYCEAPVRLWIASFGFRSAICNLQSSILNLQFSLQSKRHLPIRHAPDPRLAVAGGGGEPAAIGTEGEGVDGVEALLQRELRRAAVEIDHVDGWVEPGEGAERSTVWRRGDGVDRRAGAFENTRHARVQSGKIA